MGGPKDTDCHFWLFSFFGGSVKARAFDDLCDVRKGADFGVYRDDGDVPDFKSPVTTLKFTHQIDGAVC